MIKSIYITLTFLQGRFQADPGYLEEHKCIEFNAKLKPTDACMLSFILNYTQKMQNVTKCREHIDYGRVMRA